MAMCTLIFLVLTELSPGVAIFILNGVFIVQILIDIFHLSTYQTAPCGGVEKGLGRHSSTPNAERKEGSKSNADSGEAWQESQLEDVVGRNRFLLHMRNQLQHVQVNLQKVLTVFLQLIKHYAEVLLESWGAKVLALLLQLSGLGTLVLYTAIRGNWEGVYLRLVIGLPCVLIALSAIWSSSFQEAVAKSQPQIRRRDQDGCKISARYKSGTFRSFSKFIEVSCIRI